MNDLSIAKRLLGVLNEELDPRTMVLPPDDFTAFAKERLWIKDKSGRVMKFALNDFQQRYISIKRATIECGRPARFIVLKYRRGGLSTIEQGLSYKMCSSRSNTSVLSLSMTDEWTRRLFQIPLFMARSDPDAKKIGVTMRQRSITFDATGSVIMAMTATSGAGRGDTLQRVHGSEVGLWASKSSSKNRIADQREIVAGLTEAASHGEIVLESTPNRLEFFHHLYTEAKKGDNDWTPIFLRWFDDPTNVEPINDMNRVHELKDTMTDEEASLVRRYGLRLNQIEWRRRKRAQPELKHGNLFAQEYPEDDESCFFRSGDPFFNVGVLYELIDGLPRGDVHDIPGGTVTTWEAPMPGVSYVAGADVAEGLDGGDYSHLGIMRRDDGVQVCSIHGHFRPNVFAELIVEKCRLFNNALLGVERNNTGGGAAIQKVIDIGYRSPSVLFYMDKDSRLPTRAGWSTDVVTRDNLINALNERVCDSTDWIRDGRMVSEMLSFNGNGSGKYEADSGCHDDTIFGWGIAEQMRRIKKTRLRVID